LLPSGCHTNTEKTATKTPERKSEKTKKKTPAFYIIDGNASCQTRGSEDPKQKQKQVDTRIVESGKNKPAKKGIVSWDNNNNNNNPKKEKKRSKQANKQRQQNRREEKWYLISIIMIMIIIPSAATVATTEVDEVGNLLLLCSMLSKNGSASYNSPKESC